MDYADDGDECGQPFEATAADGSAKTFACDRMPGHEPPCGNLTADLEDWAARGAPVFVGDGPCPHCTDDETWPVLPDGYEVVGESDLRTLVRLSDGTVVEGVGKTIAEAIADAETNANRRG